MKTTPVRKERVSSGLPRGADIPRAPLDTAVNSRTRLRRRASDHGLSSSPPRQAAADAPSPRTFAQLPSDVTNHTADYLAADDLLSVGKTCNHAVVESLGLRLQAARIACELAPRVVDIAQFNALLGDQSVAEERMRSIANLPPALQAEPLVALGGRILALPFAQRDAAIEAFLAHRQDGIRSEILDDFRRAAWLGNAGLWAREAALVGGGGAARDAVQRGEPVGDVTRRFGLSADNSVGLLIIHCDAFRKPERVDEAMARMRLPQPVHRAEFESLAIDRIGANAVKRGESVESVVDRLRIRTPANIHRLHRIGVLAAARSAVAQGMAVNVAAARFDITMHDSFELMSHAVHTCGISAVIDGEPVHEVAMRLGITLPRYVRELGDLAVERVGSGAVQGGEPVRSVIDRLGITHPVHIQTLNHLGALRSARQAVARGTPIHAAVHLFGIRSDERTALELHAVNTACIAPLSRGRRVDDTARRAGIIQPVAIQMLERLAIDHHGAAAVRRGESVQSVVVRLGIFHPDNIERLNAIARHTREMPKRQRLN